VPRLQGKIVWVTGGGSGHRRAAALALGARRRGPRADRADTRPARRGSVKDPRARRHRPCAARRLDRTRCGAPHRRVIQGRDRPLDILLNQCWDQHQRPPLDKLTPENGGLMINGNLAAAAMRDRALPIIAGRGRTVHHPTAGRRALRRPPIPATSTAADEQRLAGRVQGCEGSSAREEHSESHCRDAQRFRPRMRSFPWTPASRRRHRPRSSARSAIASDHQPLLQQV